MDMVKETEELARMGLTDIKSYFGRTEADDLADKRVEVALKTLRTYSSIRSTRAREAGISVQIAKMMRLSGDALKPIFEAMSGQELVLPQIGERSNGEDGKGEPAPAPAT